MARLFRSIVLCAFVVGSTTITAEAQNLYASFIDKFDTNKDGKVDPKEVTGLNKRVYERMLGQFKLEKDKIYTVSELKEASSPPSTSSNSGSSSSSGRTFGRSRRGSSRRSSFSSRSSGKKYRTLLKLPSSYSTYDKDGDGQIGLYEWPRTRIAEFLKLDKNDDGFLTIREMGGSRSSSSSSSSSSRNTEESESSSDSN